MAVLFSEIIAFKYIPRHMGTHLKLGPTSFWCRQWETCAGNYTDSSGSQTLLHKRTSQNTKNSNVKATFHTSYVRNPRGGTWASALFYTTQLISMCIHGWESVPLMGLVRTDSWQRCCMVRTRPVTWRKLLSLTRYHFFFFPSCIVGNDLNI